MKKQLAASLGNRIEPQSPGRLIEAARLARDNAYSPYSNFKVGAAVVCDLGTTHSGCNIENASYGLTVCAERVAIFNAIAGGASRIQRLAVSTSAPEEAPLSEKMPCGACRQVMAEFMSPEAEIEIDGGGTFKLSELIPNPFQL